MSQLTVTAIDTACAESASLLARPSFGRGFHEDGVDVEVGQLGTHRSLTCHPASIHCGPTSALTHHQFGSKRPPRKRQRSETICIGPLVNAQMISQSVTNMMTNAGSGKLCPGGRSSQKSPAFKIR